MEIVIILLDTYDFQDSVSLSPITFIIRVIELVGKVTL